MKAPLWPKGLDHLWGKSPAKGTESAGETLASHTWQTLVRLAGMIRLRPDLPQRLGFAYLWRSLFWGCWLHDFGKAAEPFQRSLRGGPAWPHRHEVLSLVFIDWLAESLSEEECLWVTAAVVSHHRDADEIALRYWQPDDPADDPLQDLVATLRRDDVTGLWRWLRDCSAVWIEALGLRTASLQPPALPSEQEAIAMVCDEGAVRGRRRLYSYERWVRQLGRTRTPTLRIASLALRGHIITSDQAASAHTGDLPMASLPSAALLLDRLAVDEVDLYPHQRRCATTLGSAVLVSPTGSGKTEAALLWACAQGGEMGPVPRLFYTLPYQASLNAMYDRLNSRLFPGLVGLEHSRSVLAIYRQLIADDCARDKAAALAKWARDLARLHYFPIRVLSPYQILKGPYRLKGYETLLNDCFNAAFVLDEIHAYEPDRLAIILATVRLLREHFNARFLVMSATLPRLVLSRLYEAIGPLTEIRATPDLYAQFRRHRVQILDGDLMSERWLQQIAEVSLRGQSVLVCCNTVKRAQEAFRSLLERTQGHAEVVLLHGRFNGRDRLYKEAAIRSAVGSRSATRRPLLVVSTQVVEVSLDIDLDTIYSDPAPLEALLQRFGRVNRGRSRQWAPVHVFSKPCDGQHVYAEDLVRRALQILAIHDGRLLDEEQVSAWLDHVYTDEVASAWNQKYERAFLEFSSACLDSLHAFASDERLESEFYKAFDSVEVLPAGLLEAYRELVLAEPLEASQLLVPISWTGLARLRANGKVRERELAQPMVVDAPYSAEIGLSLG